MERKTIVVTGASDGIGAAAAKKLAALGYRVVVVGRDPEKTAAVAARIGTPYHVADYSSLDDVARLAGELSEYERIDVLCNNAGGAQNERRVTVDGNERTFQINHLGGFLLTGLLFKKLCESNATVIQTSSIAANIWGYGFDPADLENEKNYNALKAYGFSKLENILFTRELERRYAGEGIRAAVFQPGVVRSNFASESRPFIKFCYHSPLKYLFTISPEKGAERLVRLAVGRPGVDFECGAVYGASPKKIMKLKFSDPDGAAAAKLWEESLKLTGKYHPYGGNENE